MPPVNDKANPNDRQVGGSHYQAAYQHWDLAADCHLGYFEGQITKYIVRWKKKNGPEDVRKALHYYEKLCALYEENRLGMIQPHWEPAAFERFLKFQPLDRIEKTIFIGLLQYKNFTELLHIRPLFTRLLEEAEQYERLHAPRERPVRSRL